MAMAGFCTRTAARLVRHPAVVHTYHGHVLEGYFSPRRERFYTGVERMLSRGTKCIIGVSDAVRTDLISRGIGSPGKWRVVAVGLELGDLATLEPPVTARMVGIVGRLVPIKDHDTFLRAAARLPNDMRFVIAGDGELRRKLEQHAQALGVDADFRGWVRDLRALYSELDVVVLSSRNEGTPVALIEAMAAARPVVATRVGGVPDVIEDGVTGLLVPPGDPAALADAISRALEQPELGMRGRASVLERFSAERLVDDIDALYQELLRARS
jgi:glycosyltransferase involved in cell wall biosynthesis